MRSGNPLIWALLGSRTGDNNQVLALAEELGFPFEAKALSYVRLGGHDLGRIRPKHLGATLITLDKNSRKQIGPPWPDLVIGVGRRSVPVARYIRKMSGGRAKLVRIGNPRVDPRLFDLVITTPQYLLPAAANVMTLPVAMSRFCKKPEVGAKERSWLAALPQPHLLLVLGGDTKDIKLLHDNVVAAAASLAARASACHGALLIVGSPRTDPNLLRAAEPNGTIVPADGPSFAALLDDADEIFVTGDSVSMVSEAIVTGKPVGMINVGLTHAGLRGVGEERKGLLDFRSPRRDPRNFWVHLQQSGLVGTVEEPLASSTENPVKMAARAVRALLGDALEDVTSPIAVN